MGRAVDIVPTFRCMLIEYSTTPWRFSLLAVCGRRGGGGVRRWKGWRREGGRGSREYVKAWHEEYQPRRRPWQRAGGGAREKRPEVWSTVTPDCLQLHVTDHRSHACRRRPRLVTKLHVHPKLHVHTSALPSSLESPRVKWCVARVRGHAETTTWTDCLTLPGLLRPPSVEHTMRILPQLVVQLRVATSQVLVACR